jgi:hypothetical protein
LDRTSAATLSDVTEDVRDRIRELIVTGDNRLKHGGERRLYGRALESFEQALALADEHGVDDQRLRQLIGRRIEDVRALERDAAEG